ncbi:hypothetical protein Tsubulata_028021 [Turnera subulata]|uniref:Uncharacterized protein n=1 Tax=Turnera subulata TaxID=218843 RepID=A0A9Q0G3S5_9ROSI|nr:hypothetical protein Tsubulata_028021 [Turnera subulata]
MLEKLISIRAPNHLVEEEQFMRVEEEQFSWFMLWPICKLFSCNIRLASTASLLTTFPQLLEPKVFSETSIVHDCFPTHACSFKRLTGSALILWVHEKYNVLCCAGDEHKPCNSVFSVCLVKAKAALHSLRKESDGDDGSAINIYGEGWDLGEVASNGRGINASRFNLHGTGTGSFNDGIRDAMLGGSPFGTGLMLHVGMAANLRDFLLTDSKGNEIRGSTRKNWGRNLVQLMPMKPYLTFGYPIFFTTVPVDDCQCYPADKHSCPKPLNVEEEQFMWVYYEYKLREVCSAFYFPHKIQATALIVFKRFYLQWSVMEHDPKHIMKMEENEAGLEEEYPSGMLLWKALLTSKAQSNSHPVESSFWHNQENFWVLHSNGLALMPKVEMASGKIGVVADGSNGKSRSGGWTVFLAQSDGGSFAGRRWNRRKNKALSCVKLSLGQESSKDFGSKVDFFTFGKDRLEKVLRDESKEEGATVLNLLYSAWLDRNKRHPVEVVDSSRRNTKEQLF